MDQGPFPSDYWETYESELNWDYYSSILVFLIPFMIYYKLAPRMLPIYFTQLNTNDVAKVNAFCVDLGSTISSLGATYYVILFITVYFPVFDKPGMQMCFMKPNALLSAYLIADTFFRWGNVPRNFAFMVFHHIVGLCIGQTSMCIKEWFIPKAVFIAMEVANPFINIRFMILALGFSKQTWSYKIASTGLFLTFFISRIIPIPWMLYWQVEAILNDFTSQTPLHAITTFLYFSLSLMNIFWSWKIAKGFMALIGNRAHNDFGEVVSSDSKDK